MLICPLRPTLSKLIRSASPAMILVLLLAPHRRCVTTPAGMVRGLSDHKSDSDQWEHHGIIPGATRLFSLLPA
jgi:hypothetical protein